MGLEIPRTIADAATGIAVAEPSGRRLTMVARATMSISGGTTLTVAGHHHEIAGTAPALIPSEDAGAELVPYYLLGGARLRRHIPAGATIRYDDVDGIDPILLELAAEERTTRFPDTCAPDSRTSDTRNSETCFAAEGVS